MIEYNARTYLFVRGLFGGGVLGAAYTVALMLADSSGLWSAIVAAPAGVMVGAPLGGTIGIFCGMIIDGLLADKPYPILPAHMSRLHFQAHLVTLLIGGLGTFFWLNLLFQNVALPFIIIPAILSAALLPVCANNFLHCLPADERQKRKFNQLVRQEAVQKYDQ